MKVPHPVGVNGRLILSWGLGSPVQWVSVFTCTQENQIPALVWFHEIHIAGLQSAKRTLKEVRLTPQDSWTVNWVRACRWQTKLCDLRMLFVPLTSETGVLSHQKNNVTSVHSPATCPHILAFQPRPLSQVSECRGVDLVVCTADLG